MHPINASYQNADCPARLGYLVNSLTGEAYLASCKSWDCFACGPRRVRRFLARVRAGGVYRFLITLTLDGDVSDLRAAAKRLSAGWRAVYQYLRRKAGLGHYAWTRELGEKNGRLHMHAVVDAGRFDYGEAREVIARAGLGPVCDFQRLRYARAAARYVSKYLVKSSRGCRFPRYFRRAQTSVVAPRVKQSGWLFIPREKFHKATQWSEAWSVPICTQEELDDEPRQQSLALTKKEKLCATEGDFYDSG